MDRHELWKSVDLYKRKLFIRNEIKKQLLKSIKKNKYATYLQRSRASFYLSNLPLTANLSVINNRCFVTGRSQSVDRKTRTSRFVFRNKVYQSDLPGFSRAS
jgi:ribosomal protein S14